MDSDLYLQIFSTRYSHYQWEKHIEYANRCISVSADFRKDWVASLNFFKEDFGNKFLKICGKNHPLRHMLQAKGCWQTENLIKVTELLIHLKETGGGYEKLKSKLVGERDCTIEGKPFLDILLMFQSAGFISRILYEKRITTTPDIEIQDPATGEKILIEVSKLNDSDTRSLINENYEQFCNAFENYSEYVPYSFAQLRVLTEFEMTDCLKIINECRKKAIEEQSIVFYEDDMIRLGIAHISRYEELMKWIEENDYRKGLHGAPLDFNDTYRLTNNKLSKKAGQIPPQSVGMLYIPVNPLYFMVFDIKEAIRLFTAEMKKCPNLFGAVLYADIIDDANTVLGIEEGHFFSIKKINVAVSRYLFFVKNPYFNLFLSKETITKIYNSFE